MSSATLDIGNLFVYDAKLIDLNESKQNLNNYLKQLCREGTQLLINQVFQLPTQTVDDTVVVTLPKPTIVLPREKPLPKAKALTKWEQFAKLKGIQKRKKSRMVFDETKKEYLPRFGYKRTNDDTKDWLIEVKENEKDPNKDFFGERVKEKNERKAKNELQRLRNIANTRNDKVRGIGLLPNDKPNKIELATALHAAKRSDASMSKFSQRVKDEDKKTKGLPNKRKFESNFGALTNERDKQLKIFDKMVSPRDRTTRERVNVEKAVNKHIAHEEREGGDENSSRKKSFKKHKGSKSKKNNFAKKSKRRGSKGAKK